MTDDETPSQQPLRMNMSRRHEILWAVAWRGLVYSLVTLALLGCLTYIFSQTAWRFFLSDSFKMGSDAAAFFYLCIALPAMVIGWVAAINRVLSLRFSHFRLTLTSTPRRTSWLSDMLSGKDGKKHRRRR